MRLNGRWQSCSPEDKPVLICCSLRADILTSVLWILTCVKKADGWYIPVEQNMIVLYRESFCTGYLSKKPCLIPSLRYQNGLCPYHAGIAEFFDELQRYRSHTQHNDCSLTQTQFSPAPSPCLKLSHETFYSHSSVLPQDAWYLSRWDLLF